MLSDFGNYPTQYELSFPDLITAMQKKLAAWNKNTFGNVFKQKECVLRQIQRVQAEMYINRSPFIYQQERDLLQTYHQILEEERDY